MNDNSIGGGNPVGNPSENFPHQPVLYQEVLDVFKPESGRDYLDGTLGAGGHAEGILVASSPEGRLLGLDVDPLAISIAQERLIDFGDRVIIRQTSYQEAAAILKEIGWQKVHGVLLDLGVSSMQIDRPDRGFSFMENGPLDMRFNPDSPLSAYDLVNHLDEGQLADILWQFGEERYSRRIARAIVSARPVHTTQALTKVIQEAVPRYESQIHPATRTFQALRIATNKELETLSSSLMNLVDCIHPGGLIAVISFHSLEDRIVKQFFKKESQDCICPPEQPICTCDHIASLDIITKKPVRPTENEVKENPRASSARMRVARRK